MQIPIRQLIDAWQKVRRGSRAAGIDGITVDLYKPIASERLDRLQRQLQDETYGPMPVKGFYLRKAAGGRRLVGLATVDDRVVQRWLLGRLYPTLEAQFCELSYAYRPGRNIHQAAARLAAAYRSRSCWIVKADIDCFFDSLCHGLLLAEVAQLGVPMGLERTIAQLVRAGIVVGGRTTYPGSGVIQGHVLSGALANLYLTPFDRRCAAAGWGAVRYGDDVAIAFDRLEAAERAVMTIDGWLKDRFLALNGEKTTIYGPGEPFAFLGYRFENGVAIAPPPPTIKPGWERPYGARPPVRKPPRSTGRPPSCARSRSAVTHKRAPALQYFAEPMTTLYVTDQGAYLKVQNYQFLVLLDHEVRARVPVARVGQVVLFGCCNVSHGAVRLALQRRISVMYLSYQGRYFGRLDRHGDAKVEYLTRQVRRADEMAFHRAIAIAIVEGKLHNSRVLLMRLRRRRPGDRLESAIALLATLLVEVATAADVAAVRGYEGKGATAYFQALGETFEGPFAFERRTKRPPTDPVNSLMSLGYTLLSHNVHAFVEAIGLHAHFGHLHANYDWRPALVCDLMEEFRAPMVDSLVVYLVNANIFGADDFTPPDDRGGVYLHRDALPKFVKHWEERLQMQVTHWSGTQVTYRRCIELQVREYLARLMDDLDAPEPYRPMRWPVK